MASIKSNFIYSSLCQILNIIVPLVTTPYLSRVLGAGGIGNYAYSYSVASYFSIFIILGLNSYGNRSIAMARGKKECVPEIFWNIYAFQMISGIIVLSLYMGYVFTFCKEWLYGLLMVGVVMASCFEVTWFFYGIEDFKSITQRDVLIKLLTVACIFLFVKKSDDTWKYVLIRSLGFFMSQILLWPKIFKTVGFMKPSYDKVLSYIKPNLVLFLPTIAVSIYKTMDKIMLGLLSNISEVGYYENCEKVIQVPMAVIIALGTVMLPHMSKMYSEFSSSKEQAINIIRKSEHFLIIISTVICFGIMGIADIFVPVFYGDGFERCVNLFYILLPSCIFLAFANVIRTQFLIPNKMDKEFIISLFAGAIINLIANVMFISSMGATGTAIGTLAAEISVCMLQMFFIRKRIPIFRIFKECIVYIVVAVLMMIVGIVLPSDEKNIILSLLIKIIVCGLFWFVSMIILLFVDKQRKKIFEGIL